MRKSAYCRQTHQVRYSIVSDGETSFFLNRRKNHVHMQKEKEISHVAVGAKGTWRDQQPVTQKRRYKDVRKAEPMTQFAELCKAQSTQSAQGSKQSSAETAVKIHVVTCPLEPAQGEKGDGDESRTAFATRQMILGTDDYNCEHLRLSQLTDRVVDVLQRMYRGLTLIEGETDRKPLVVQPEDTMDTERASAPSSPDLPGMNGPVS
jgi:hypothetical protein